MAKAKPRVILPHQSSQGVACVFVTVSVDQVGVQNGRRWFRV